jgi:predicted DNA-binding protein with PD1-like motif
MTVTSSSARHLLLQLKAPSSLPRALHDALRDEVVLAGWVSATGMVESVELKVAGSDATHTLRGPLQIVSLSGSVGLRGGDVSCGMSVVLARYTDTGLETVAGELVSARVAALDVMVLAFDDATATRASAHGMTLLETVSPIASAQAAPSAPVVSAAGDTESSPRLVATAEASAPQAAPSSPSLTTATNGAPPKPAQPGGAAPMPVRPSRPQVELVEEVYPDEGDIVEHFAFGRCDVVKSDGDRLHLRLGKDGRVKEIALEMLKVTPLEPIEGASGKHYKLDRKL